MRVAAEPRRALPIIAGAAMAPASTWRRVKVMSFSLVSLSTSTLETLYARKRERQCASRKDGVNGLHGRPEPFKKDPSPRTDGCDAHGWGCLVALEHYAYAKDSSPANERAWPGEIAAADSAGRLLSPLGQLGYF